VKGWSTPITITDPAPPAASTITLSSTGTVQEASPGAGVNVQETVTAPGLNTVYWAVFTSANVAEEGWQTATVNSNGTGTFTANFEHSGDYIVAVNNPNAETVKGWSTPITITPAGPVVTDSAGHSYTLPAPTSGSQTLAPAQTGLNGTVSETVSGQTDQLSAGAGGMSPSVNGANGDSYIAIDFANATFTAGSANERMIFIGAGSADVGRCRCRYVHLSRRGRDRHHQQLQQRQGRRAGRGHVAEVLDDNLRCRRLDHARLRERGAEHHSTGCLCLQRLAGSLDLGADIITWKIMARGAIRGPFSLQAFTTLERNRTYLL
jgi:hypothetical protein